MNVFDSINWTKRNHDMLRVGGSWSVPRSGLIFIKTDDGFQLIAVMPYTTEMATAKRMWGADVPQSADELLAYQRTDFQLIKKHHALAGLTLTDPKGLLTTEMK